MTRLGEKDTIRQCSAHGIPGEKKKITFFRQRGQNFVSGSLKKKIFKIKTQIKAPNLSCIIDLCALILSQK